MMTFFLPTHQFSTIYPEKKMKIYIKITYEEYSSSPSPNTGTRIHRPLLSVRIWGGIATVK
jgi:hypothetical protein